MAEFWNNTSIKYNQRNRIIERFLTDLRSSKQVNFSLESCNVCAAACAIESVGGNWKLKLPSIDGNAIFSQADLMFNYIYSYPKGLPVLDNGNGVCENECIENLAFAVKKLSNCKAECYYNGNNADLVDDIIEQLLNNNAAIVTSYKDDITTGHYICIVKYDTDAENFIYYDSWNENPRNKNNGSLESISKNELVNCIKHRYMSVYL